MKNKLELMKSLIETIDENIIEYDGHIDKYRKAKELSIEDEENGKKYTIWERARELDCSNAPRTKGKIKETLKIVRRLSLELEKEMEVE